MNPTGPAATETLARRRDAVLAELRSVGTAATRDGLSRFGIVVSSGEVYGVAMKEVHRVAKGLGRDHALAAALWATGVYEARLLCCFVDDPAAIGSQQMDAWCRDCDNWAVVDTLCFHLFLHSPLAWSKIAAWSREEGEFQKRAAFALLASVALRVKDTPESELRRGLALIEAASTDDRNFVKKAVSWALRGIATRPALADEALGLAERLAASEDKTARWIGKDARKEIAKKASVTREKTARAPSGSRPKNRKS